MNELKSYIKQAREHGISDAQIRQNLLVSGWDQQSIDAVLTSPDIKNSPMNTSIDQQNYNEHMQTTKKSRKLSFLYIALTVIVLAVIAGSIYVIFSPKTSAQTVAQNFINDISTKNKTAADALESPAAKAYFLKYFRSPSIYTFCQSQGIYCTDVFKPSFLARAVKVNKSYTASNGTKGQMIIYTVKETLTGAAAGGSGCSSSGTTTVTISLIPKGNSWQIDNVDQESSLSANPCLNTAI